MKRLIHWFMLPIRHHFWGSLAIVVITSGIIAVQVTDRRNFANSELHDDVIDRWGAPIEQPAPSVRYVGSGTVFTELKSLPLAKQDVALAATMNYRKRGLSYFSGFDFTFNGHYEVVNPESHDIDIVFVFPVEMAKNKVLLSELSFEVNGEMSPIEHNEGNIDKVVWTGRIGSGSRVAFNVRFTGRGLESFVYALDPALPVEDFHFAMNVRGGDNYDYPGGIVPAHVVKQSNDRIDLSWNYPALQSGVPMGAILPSQKSYDQIIGTMALRGFAPFLLLFAGFTIIAIRAGRKLRFFEVYLIAAVYALHSVMVAYFTAFMNFYVAYSLASIISVTMAVLYSWKLLGKQNLLKIFGLFVSTQWIPTMAIIAEGYTGLIYTIEIIFFVAAVMYFTTRKSFLHALEKLLAGPAPKPKKEVSHAV